MEYYRVGLVTRPHGVRGGMKLLPLTDDTSRFEGLREAYLEQGGNRRKVMLHSVSIQPDAVTLYMEGVESREDAAALRGAYLCVDKAHAVKLPPGRYFIADLIGCAVTDTQDVTYGKVTEVLHTGANDVYEIAGEKPMLLPALKKVLLEVDTDNKRILIDAEVVKEVAVFAD